jgi:hypothetical protein
MYQGLTGHQTKHYLDGYTALLKALQVQKNDHNLLQAKGPYEAVLTQGDRLKAECAAGVKSGNECVGVSVQACSTVPKATEADSMQAKMASEVAAHGEQGNMLLQKSGDITTQHLPPSLMNKYSGGVPSVTASWDERSRHLLFFGFLGGMVVFAGCYWAARSMGLTNWMALKVLGGKKAHTGGIGGGDGSKYV